MFSDTDKLTAMEIDAPDAIGEQPIFMDFRKKSAL